MNRIEIKPNNVSIDRIEEKCINCGLCHKSCPVYFKPHNEENLAEIYAC